MRRAVVQGAGASVGGITSQAYGRISVRAALRMNDLRRPTVLKPASGARMLGSCRRGRVMEVAAQVLGGERQRADNGRMRGMSSVGVGTWLRRKTAAARLLERLRLDRFGEDHSILMLMRQPGRPG